MDLFYSEILDCTETEQTQNYGIFFILAIDVVP
jgi:hypothetical protein